MSPSNESPTEVFDSVPYESGNVFEFELHLMSWAQSESADKPRKVACNLLSALGFLSIDVVAKNKVFFFFVIAKT